MIILISSFFVVQIRFPGSLQTSKMALTTFMTMMTELTCMVNVFRRLKTVPAPKESTIYNDRRLD